jgi:aminocarboxymuconate-semialdehyde decarboxylase
MNKEMNGANARDYRIVDSHFHWFPKDVEEELNSMRGVSFRHGSEWYDLDGQLAHLDSLGRGTIDVVCSGGVSTGHFGEVSATQARDFSRHYNEAMNGAQRKYAGRVWGAAILPLQDTALAIDELDHAINTLGLVGVSLPGNIGRDENIDDPRLEPLYDRLEELGVPIFLHPCDVGFQHILDGYGGALHLSLGRIVDVSVSAYRLVLSGIMERHPDLTVVMSHTGGALPYQAGRLDKNSRGAKLPAAPSSYLKRMYTDTVSPHTMGVRFAVEFYGVDHVMYGSDYPCWSPQTALEIVDELELNAIDHRKLTSDTARSVLALREPVKADR